MQSLAISAIYGSTELTQQNQVAAKVSPYDEKEDLDVSVGEKIWRNFAFECKSLKYICEYLIQTSL